MPGRNFTHPAGQGIFGGIVLWLTSVFGCIAFAGSAMVWLKMNKRFVPEKPVLFTGQTYLTRIVLGGILLAGALFFFDTVAPEAYLWYTLFSALALFFGVLYVLPDDTADIPLVVYLLNAFTGLSACTSGFIFQNPLLIAAGALVAASCLRQMWALGEETGRPPLHVLSAGLRSEKGKNIE
ncbi:MAG: NAD(P)(+) transhydrogenase (Re/Si-specific) subunit beta [Lewinellaceae bacterium]|nr:NAD(P)(+) transhydrogenase (Re/Si-specific) subunit beta [Lewinellaceae bacterium]